MSKDNDLPKSSAALETAILNILPKYVHAAIPVDAILYRLHIHVTKDSRANLYSRVSNGVKLLVDGELCNRSKSFNIYHYWKNEDTLNKKDPSLLSTKVKEEIIREKAYTFAPSAESAFLDLLYLYKSNQKVKGNEFIKDFTKWFKETISSRHGPSITRETLIVMQKTLQLQIKISQRNKGIGKGVGEKVEGVGHLKPSKITYRNRNIIFQAIPLEENQAITARQLSTSLVIPLAQSTVSADLSALWREKRVNRNWNGNAFRYWCNAASDNIQILVTNIGRAGYTVVPSAYGKLASLEAQYTAWQGLSDTYIISPNSITFYTYKDDFVPTKITIAVSKSLTKFLEELAGQPSRNAMDVLVYLKATQKKAKEVLRIANDETVMKRIESGRIPVFDDSILAIFSRGLEAFHPTIMTKPSFLQWFIAQLGANQDITQSTVSTIKNHRLETIIKYDEKVQTLEKKHPPGYPSVTYPLVQMDSSSQQDILTRIKTVEDDITQIHERYAKIEGIIEEKELSGKLQKLEESKDKEQQKLDLLEEKLRKWNTDDSKCNAGILK